MQWAVAYMNFTDNQLTVEIIEANTMTEAMSKHSRLNGGCRDWLKNMPNDLQQIRDLFWEADAAIDIALIEESEENQEEPVDQNR